MATSSTTYTWLACVLVVAGCAETVTERGGPVDAGADARADIVLDTGVDVFRDTGIDVLHDTGVDVAHDTGVDVVVDTGVDVVVDTGVDVAADVPAGCSHTSVMITGGTFMMGATDIPDEGAVPVHQVTIGSYSLDATEVTVCAFRSYWNAGHPAAPASVMYPAGLMPVGGAASLPGLCNGSPTWTTTPGSMESYPVNCVDWYTAAGYCAWVGGRLPTEAEWEFAASNGGMTEYPWGNTDPVNQLCWSAESFLMGPCPTDAFPSGDTMNPAGIHDLAGDLWEWVYDAFADYPASALVNPTGPAEPTTGTQRLERGGGWYETGAVRVRAEIRGRNPVTTHGSDLGFRCAYTTPD